MNLPLTPNFSLGRIYYLDAMAPASKKGQVVSNLTLAYMEDTGWYLPDYAMTSTSIAISLSGLPWTSCIATTLCTTDECRLKICKRKSK